MSADIACLTGDNMAAVGLALKKTALQAESRMFVLERQLRAAANRPTIVQTSTAAITGLAANTAFTSYGPIGGGSFVTNFNNTGFDRNIDNGSRVQYGDSNGTGEGLYQFGAYLNAVASGAVDDNTYRVMTIEQWRRLPSGIEVRIARSALTEYETNTGVGSSMCTIAEFNMIVDDRIRFFFVHGNNSSTMNISIGTIIWSSKISSPDGVVIS